MKITFTFLLCCVFLFANAQTSLCGKIIDGNTGEELIAANIVLYKEGVMVTGKATDFNGNYCINIDPGTYDIEVSYIGYQANRINGVVVMAGQVNKFDLKLGTRCAAIDLVEIVVTDYKVPLIQQDNTTQGRTITSQNIRNFASKNISSVSSATAGLSQSKNNTTSKPDPLAGLLTAGEWKDLDNWGFWNKLMKDQQFSQYRDYWGFHPDHRFELKLSDKKGRPLTNIKVNLLNKKQEVVWSAKSDNKGSACLWGNFYGGDDGDFDFQIMFPEGEQKVAAIPYTIGLNSFLGASKCASSNAVDVAFVVDVSGSMHDEIKYLIAELSDVIDRAENEEDSLKIRTAGVYYSGEKESKFLNRSSLSLKEEETINFLKTSPLGGGSHEAVHLGLGKAIRELDWNKDAIARIAFLLLDEPPAHNENVKKETHELILKAATMGIKVIPIAASGTNKATEFLLKFFAMGTNSTYTFLTDHSGIGDKHMAPEAGSYNVETLNDLMVRLIVENSSYHLCEEEVIPMEKIVNTKKLSRKERRNKTTKNLAKQIKYFPNPASDHVIIDLEKALDLLLITSTDGKIVVQYPQVNAGQIRLQTSDWAPGMYYLHFYENSAHIVEKLVVVKK